MRGMPAYKLTIVIAFIAITIVLFGVVAYDRCGGRVTLHDNTKAESASSGSASIPKNGALSPISKVERPLNLKRGSVPWLSDDAAGGVVNGEVDLGGVTCIDVSRSEYKLPFSRGSSSSLIVDCSGRNEAAIYFALSFVSKNAETSSIEVTFKNLSSKFSGSWGHIRPFIKTDQSGWSALNGGALRGTDYTMVVPVVGNTTVAMRPFYGKTEQDSLASHINTSQSGLRQILLKDVDGLEMQAVYCNFDPSTESGYIDKRPSVLLYGAEVTGGADSAWLVDGAARWIASDTPRAIELRTKFRWILIPRSIKANSPPWIINGFVPAETVAPTDALAGFLTNLADRGLSPHVSIEITSFMSALSPPLKLDCVQSDLDEGLDIEFQQMVRNEFKSHSFDTSEKVLHRNQKPATLAGYVAQMYGGMAFFYEVNSQTPKETYLPERLQAIGDCLVRGVGTFLGSSDLEALIAQREMMLIQRQSAIGKFGELLTKNGFLKRRAVHYEWKVFDILLAERGGVR